MKIRIGFIMDPLADITPYKDSTLAMMLAAQARGWELFEIHMQDMALYRSEVTARMRQVAVRDDNNHWHDVIDVTERRMNDLDVVLMRKDPPFNMDYIYATYLLEQVEAAGTPVFNRPQALRDANEKLFTLWFPECCPPTLVTARHESLRDFIREHDDVIVKPLDGMGGTGVFRLRADDPNINSVLETLTMRYRRSIMAQTFIPEIRDGDKRVLVINGETFPYVLARTMAPGETRANLAAGAGSHAQPLSNADRRIAERVAPELVRRGILFAGLDVIGEHLTEINVTSPTCIREITRDTGENAAETLMDAIQQHLSTR